jgi:CRP/FNR family transcriptional regulator, cyclic AMP receptor protein
VTCQPQPELISFLLSSPFYGGLSEDAATFLTGLMTERCARAGEVLVREGEPGRSMFVVVEGVLHLCRAKPDGSLLKLRLLRPGDFVGTTALIEMEPRPFTVVVEKDARLLELCCQDLYKLYRHDLKAWSLVVMNINRELCRHLRSAGQLISKLMEGQKE